MSDTPHNRPWFQFSLRTLFLVVLLVTVFFGGRASMQPTIQAEQARAVDAERKAKEVSRQALVQSATLIRWVRISDELE